MNKKMIPKRRKQRSNTSLVLGKNVKKSIRVLVESERRANVFEGQPT